MKNGPVETSSFIHPIAVWHGVSKGVEDSRRLPALRVGHPRNGPKAISVLARLQGVEPLGMADPGETLWIP
jgi:hypothetical protein